MRGKIVIESTEHGHAIDCDLDDISILDKFELMHTVANILMMDEIEMNLYLIAERLGIMRDAESAIRCFTDDQLQSLLRGEKPGVVTIDMNELRRQLNES